MDGKWDPWEPALAPTAQVASRRGITPVAAPLLLQSPLARKPPASSMTLANAAYLGIQRYANNRVKENWTTGS